MRTLLVRNVDGAERALAQTLQHDGMGATRTLPIPVCLAMTTPFENVSRRHPKPSALLVNSVQAIFDHVPGTTLPQLREGTGRWTVGTHQLMVTKDIEGKLQAMTCSPSWDLASWDLTTFAVLQEYLAAEAHCPPGLLFATIFTAYSSEDPAEHALDPSNDCYTSGDMKAPISMISLPVGRWRREVETCIAKKGEGRYDDPWIQGTLAQCYRVNAEEDVDRKREIATAIVSPDWRRAIMEAECQS